VNNKVISKNDKSRRWGHTKREFEENKLTAIKKADLKLKKNDDPYENRFH
jgi:hypothetical protein